MKKAALVLGLLVAGSEVACARENPYAGLDYSTVTFNTSTADLNVSAVRMRVGTELGKYVGAEYQGLVGIDHDDVVVSGGTMTGELKGAIGMYLRGKLPLGDAFDVYGLAGYSWSWITVSSQVPKLLGRTGRDEDFSAGVGMEAKVLGKAFLSVDYMEYTQGLTAVSAGVRLPF